MSYYEIHVTVDCSDKDLLDKLCQETKYKYAEFIMKNDRTDIICTAKTSSQGKLDGAMEKLTGFLWALKEHNISAKRYKVEHILVDSKDEPGLVSWFSSNLND